MRAAPWMRFTRTLWPRCASACWPDRARPWDSISSAEMRSTVSRLREMIARDHLPHAIILTGPRGAGKFTLAQMVAKAVNCLERPLADDGLPDFCGRAATASALPRPMQLGAALCRSRGSAREPARKRQARDPHLRADPSRSADHSSRSAADAGESGPGAARDRRDVLPPCRRAARSSTSSPNRTS